MTTVVEEKRKNLVIAVPLAYLHNEKDSKPNNQNNGNPSKIKTKKRGKKSTLKA